jgi:hypothetical protein
MKQQPFSRLRKTPRTTQYSASFRTPERPGRLAREVNPRNFQSCPTKVISQGMLRTDSGCRYAAAPSSFGNRIRFQAAADSVNIQPTSGVPR